MRTLACADTDPAIEGSKHARQPRSSDHCSAHAATLTRNAPDRLLNNRTTEETKACPTAPLLRPLCSSCSNPVGNPACTPGDAGTACPEPMARPPLCPSLGCARGAADLSTTMHMKLISALLNCLRCSLLRDTLHCAALCCMTHCTAFMKAHLTCQTRHLWKTPLLGKAQPLAWAHIGKRGAMVCTIVCAPLATLTNQSTKFTEASPGPPPLFASHAAYLALSGLPHALARPAGCPRHPWRSRRTAAAPLRQARCFYSTRLFAGIPDAGIPEYGLTQHAHTPFIPRYAAWNRHSASAERG